MNKKSLLSILLLILSAGFSTSCRESSKSSFNNEPVSGGSCQYKDYKGIVTIKDVRRDSSKKTSPVDPQEKIYVSFTFEAEGYAPPAASKISKEIELKQSEIDQKNVKIGKQFRTKASYIESGTCNPGPYLDDFEKWQ